MRILTSAVAMQRLAQRWRREGARVGLVPTMGCLHAGHLSLVARARRLVGPRGQVVVSLYVNPTQFAPHEDLAKYPRDLPGDVRRCRDAGVNVLFVPTDASMYPKRPGAEFSTYVVEESLSRGMEGSSRPTHFRGVTTVVAKLFQLVLPDLAVFGAKDYQQAAVVRRMVRDLNFPLRIVVSPTVRERDGLAMSSRNRYLSAAERRQAVALWQALTEARRAVRAARRPLPAGRLKAELKWLIETRPAARVDQIELFDPHTLRPLQRVGRGAHLALAVFVGQTRLIDNGRL
jgi:pantoate--beta-alanine ligase